MWKYLYPIANIKKSIRTSKHIYKVVKGEEKPNTRKLLGLDPIKKSNTGNRALDSFIDNVCKDMVKPLEGSIVFCKLANEFEHSGVYIGNGLIVHLDGNGEIEIVTPRKFLQRLDGYNPSISIYVSCIDKQPIRSRKIANRAKKRVGKNGYSLLSNNCHKFTSSCITGDLDNNDTTFSSLEETATNVLGVNEWRVWNIPY